MKLGVIRTLTLKDHLDNIWTDWPVYVKKVDIVQAQPVERAEQRRLNLLGLHVLEVHLCGDEQLLPGQPCLDGRRESCADLCFVACRWWTSAHVTLCGTDNPGKPCHTLARRWADPHHTSLQCQSACSPAGAPVPWLSWRPAPYSEKYPNRGEAFHSLNLASRWERLQPLRVCTLSEHVTWSGVS